MKKTIIFAAISISLFSQAQEWSNFSFPKNNPIYQSISKSDVNNESKLTFYCLKEFKDSIFISVSKLDLNIDKGEFNFLSSNEDKFKTKINGFFTKSKDGVINLITDYDNKKTIKELKDLKEFSIVFKDKEKELKTKTYNLNGSNLNLNILKTKCDNIK